MAYRQLPLSWYIILFMNCIRTHFQPFQPTIEHTSPSLISYEEIQPSEKLENYIYCYWRLHTKEKLEEPYLYRVVSDGCIDILFEQSRPEQVFINGFSPKYIEFELEPTFDYLGIRFLPTGYPTLFDTSADTLTNQFLPLGQVNTTIDTAIKNNVVGKLDLASSKKVFDTLFASFLDQDAPPSIDQRFENALNQILEAHGHIAITDLDVGLSERQLRRLFKFYFGESGKAFSKIVRFQNILAAKPSTQSLKHQKIYYSNGYYDQAHFIKEFKEFYGVTPSRAFGK